METKICSMCRIEKIKAAFRNSAKSKDGKNSLCKSCHSSYEVGRVRGALTVEQKTRRAQVAASDKYRKMRAAYAKSPIGKFGSFKTRLRVKYGITVSQWIGMWDLQKGFCARCFIQMSKPPQLDGLRGRAARNTASVDHCHATGKVRALLCGPCNRRIGHLEQPDARHILDMDYLRQHQSSSFIEWPSPPTDNDNRCRQFRSASAT